MGDTHNFDVIVVGGGNAALCAALSAREHGAKVLVIEAASKEDRGGNSRFAGTIFRTPHEGLESIKTILYDEEALADTKLCTIEPYTKEMYSEDLAQVSHGRNDPAMSKVLLDESWSIMKWMKDYGVKWITTLRRYYNVEGQKGKSINVEPGAAIMSRNNGVGLMESLYAAVEKTSQESNPITIKYDCPAHDLLLSGDTVLGVRTRQRDDYVDIHGRVILASGGFSANPEMRRKYLGEGWDLVLVRGTKYNTGTMLNRAIDAGARTVGHWGAAHASPQDFHGPLMGDIKKSPHIVCNLSLPSEL